MSYITTNPLKNSTIMLIYAEKDEIQLDPPYQRMGDVWTNEKKQLLIDSILNDYDIPKIYFHSFNEEQKSEKLKNYAVIDGRQRLEAIWGFIDGKFALSDDFELQRYPNINLAGLTYEDIAQSFPKVKIKFDSFVLPIVGIETEDEELIEDMFSRLNEAVPLNAAEKRNSIGGAMVKCIRTVSEHSLFSEKVSFSNRRYQHREVAARLLLIELNLTKWRKLIDTKKVYLDAMAKNNANNPDEVEEYRSAVTKVLDAMNEVFSPKDVLLRAQGNMAIYYLLFRSAIEKNELGKISRRKILDFNERLVENRKIAANNYELSSFELLEFDRLTQQGTNDASNIKERFSVLAKEMGISNIEM